MGKADTPAKRAYNDQYLKENMKQISLKLSKIYKENAGSFEVLARRDVALILRR